MTLNTDNRLMSAISMSGETLLARNLFDLSTADVLTLQRSAINAGFADWTDRKRLLERLAPS